MIQFSYYSWLEFFYASTLLFTVVMIILRKEYRAKLLYLVLVSVTSSSLGFFIGLDGYMFFFISSQFVAVLLIWTCTERVSEYKTVVKKSSWYKFTYFLGLFVFFFYVPLTYTNCNIEYLHGYLQVWEVQSRDFFAIYWVFISVSPILGGLLATLLGLFSFFFYKLLFFCKKRKIYC